MTKKEQEQRDRNFRKLCKWFEDAAEIAEIICQENSRLCNLMTRLQFTPDEQGFHSVYVMLNFLTALYQSPQDYEGEPDNQRNEYPELAFGMMELARRIGQMKINDEQPVGGWL